MPLLSGTASVYDETGMGASVDAFALGDRQCIKGYWMDASVDAFALGDRQ